MNLIKRSNYLDNLKGILILLVVFGHFLWEYKDVSGYIENITVVLYVFHMPAFLLVSGYLSASESSQNINSLAKILFLFFILNYSMMFYAYFFDNREFSFSKLYYSSWYLLALFVYRITLPIFQKSTLMIFVSFGASFLIGFINKLDNFFVLQKIIALHPFFLVGYFISKRVGHHNFRFIRNRQNLIGIILFVVLLVVGLFFVRNYISVREVIWLSYGSFTDILNRIITTVLACLFTFALLLATPQKAIPFIVQWGKNSLAIYVLHRIVTLIYAQNIRLSDSFALDFCILAASSFLVTYFLGSELVSTTFNRFIDAFFKRMVPEMLDSKGAKLSFLLTFLGMTAFGVVGGLQHKDELAKLVHAVKKQVNLIDATDNSSAKKDVLFKILTEEKKEIIKQSVVISYVGDLILLRDMVDKAYKPKKEMYDFSDMFDYTDRFFKNDDFTIGVLEGPLAGKEFGYSTSSLNDGIKVYLNFPDVFAKDIKHAGIDFVTTSNNHILDMGLPGVERTINTLKDAELPFIGSYTSLEEKQNRNVQVKLVNGLRIAILAYTYGSNYHTEEQMLSDEYSHVTSMIVPRDSKNFERVKQAVNSDFEKAKSYDPDVIIVLPHMGSQLTPKVDKLQQTWNEVFVEFGANIILSASSHVLQPVEWRKSANNDAGYVLIINCPGDFVNSYTDRNADINAIMQIHLDPLSGMPELVAIIPTLAHANGDNLYQAIPLIDFDTNPNLRSSTSNLEKARLIEAQKVSTSITMGVEINFDQAEEKYHFFPDGYYRANLKPIALTDSHKKTRLYKVISESDSVMFIGDSITEGTKNGGYGWYEPLMSNFSNVNVKKSAKGGETTITALERGDFLNDVADVYIIALGTNDVRYRSEKSAMTSDAYVNNIKTIVDRIQNLNEKAFFVFISPWTTDHYDPYTPLSETERISMLSEYGIELKKFAINNEFLFIDPNPEISKTLNDGYARDFLIDHIHPNVKKGIDLYSNAVINASPNN